MIDINKRIGSGKTESIINKDLLWYLINDIFRLGEDKGRTLILRLVLVERPEWILVLVDDSYEI